MLIVLSNNLSSKQKELVINTLFEVQEGLPHVINFYQPLKTIVSRSEKDGLIPSKCTGDEVYSDEHTRNLEKIYESIKDTVKNTLASKVLTKISQSEDRLIVLDSIPSDSIRSVVSQNISYGIGDFDESVNIKKIQIFGNWDYMSIKSSLLQFFEEVTKIKEISASEIAPKEVFVTEVNEKKGEIMKEQILEKLKKIEAIIKGGKQKVRNTLDISYQDIAKLYSEDLKSKADEYGIEDAEMPIDQ